MYRQLQGLWTEREKHFSFNNFYWTPKRLRDAITETLLKMEAVWMKLKYFNNSVTPKKLKQRNLNADLKVSHFTKREKSNQGFSITRNAKIMKRKIIFISSTQQSF